MPPLPLPPVLIPAPTGWFGLRHPVLSAASYSMTGRYPPVTRCGASCLEGTTCGTRSRPRPWVEDGVEVVPPSLKDSIFFFLESPSLPLLPLFCPRSPSVPLLPQVSPAYFLSVVPT